MPTSEPCVRFLMCLRKAFRANGDNGATPGLPVLDVRTIKNPSEKITSAISSRAISLRRNPHEQSTSITALSRWLYAVFRSCL